MTTAEQKKGRAFELEVARALGGKRDPSSGAQGDHDLIMPTDGIYADWAWECKRRAALPYLVTNALAQAQMNIRIGDRRRPAMAMRADGGRAIVAMHLEDFVTWSTSLAEFGQRGRVRGLAKQLDGIARELREVF